MDIFEILTGFAVEMERNRSYTETRAEECGIKFAWQLLGFKVTWQLLNPDLLLMTA